MSLCSFLFSSPSTNRQMPAVYRVDRRENTPELRLWLDNEASPGRSDSGTGVETHSSLPASLPSSPAPHPIPFFSFFCFPPRPPASNLRCFCVPFPGSRARMAVINCARVAGHSRRTTSDVLPPPRVRLRISEKGAPATIPGRSDLRRFFLHVLSTIRSFCSAV